MYKMSRTLLDTYQSELLIESESCLPRALLKLPGVGQLLASEDDSDEPILVTSGTGTNSKASQIISQAQIQKGNASTYRLGQTARTVGTATWSHPLGQKNLTKARLIQAERNQKRDEAKTLETNIRISITGWLHEKPKKLTQVCIIWSSLARSLFCNSSVDFQVSLLSYVKAFQADTTTQVVLDTLLEWVQSAWQRQHPYSNQLTW